MTEMPQRMGPYEIREKIGSGGMGVVYKAWDARLNRHVALKTLWPALAADPAARERLLREARAAAAINHPNVTQIYDIGEENGGVYLAMEYLEGGSLQDLMRQGRLSPGQAVSLIRQTALGLKAAAERGIIHRDIKPSNLVLSEDGTVKITDFGLAKQLFASSNLTATGELMGTPNYIAPEQAQGGQMDARSDIYSLGATMYEMLVGRPPFSAPSAVAVAMKHVTEPVPPVRQVNPQVSPSLATLVESMLSKFPETRPPDYADLIRQLDRMTFGTPVGDAGRTQLARRTATAGGEPSSRFATKLIGAALVLATALLVGKLFFGKQEAPPLGSLGTGFDPPTAARDGDSASARDSSARPAARGAEPLPALRLPIDAGPAQLKILDAQHEFTSDGRLHVMGRVRNLGGSWASGIKMHVLVKDEAGEVVDSTEVPLRPVRIGPGEDGLYEAFFPDPERHVRIELELNWVS